MNTLSVVSSRELLAAFVNRSLQVFAIVALAGGCATVIFSSNAEEAFFLLLQIVLYFVSLFALLTGISSARAESEEWPLIFSQPGLRRVYVLGKFVALWGFLSILTLLLFLPAIYAGAALRPLALIYFQSLEINAVFVSLGLFAGFLAKDRAQGLILGIIAWLLLLVGTDLLALIASHWSLFQQMPNLWVTLLIVNPLDAFRIQTLFALEQIPAEMINHNGLAVWWIGHGLLTLTTVATVWTLALLTSTGWWLNQIEEF